MKTNNKQQTAVEQLISKIPLGIRMQLAELGIDFEQAKEMEKQRMIDAHINGQSEFDKGARRIKNDELAEMWYNETYGGDNK